MSDFLRPLEQSASADIYEEQLKALFIAVLNDLYGEKINDIYGYGTPAYASQKVLERFIKQIGLVVLRRPNTSHLIMRILYENWTSLPSKRGLAFLEFVLEMLWTNQWKIIRLWHSKILKNQYPNYLTVTEQPDSFLTSRIYVLMEPTIDQQELESLSPSLVRLVPANIVPEFGVGLFAEDAVMGIACAAEAFQVAYFIPEVW
ncbi:hypothetical protein [Acinetobacter venetianus]|uniref:hypothetical protein n=1 Tax=Acinetobacter venetianus TaxID=52133 RepID=UPI003A8F7BD5